MRKLQLRRKQHQLKKGKQHQLKKRKLPRKAKGVQQVEEEEVQDAKKKKIFYNSPIDDIQNTSINYGFCLFWTF